MMFAIHDAQHLFLKPACRQRSYHAGCLPHWALVTIRL